MANYLDVSAMAEADSLEIDTLTMLAAAASPFSLPCPLYCVTCHQLISDCHGQHLQTSLITLND